MEAAALLPVTMVVLVMLLQPACLLYTRSVMRSAAAQTARVAATAAGDVDEEACVAYARRRLDAIPDVGIFHEGGASGWDVRVDGIGGASVEVEIVGRARPLPVVGGLAWALGGTDRGGIELSAKVSERVRPEWLEGEYGDWVGEWDS